MSSSREEKKDVHACMILSVSIVFINLFCFIPPIACQNAQDMKNNPEATSKMMSGVLLQGIANQTKAFKSEIAKKFSFCVTDVDTDWNNAFDFSQDPTFLTNCVKQRGDMMQRLCTAAEIEYYFTGAFLNEGKTSNYLNPNKNCNLTSWLTGCEPGWACSAGNQHIDLENSKEIPIRAEDCTACCEGFFCPNGLTCMIPCPLGAYCPLAKLNQTTGKCDPYTYQQPPGNPNHTCGGADIWADVQSSSEVFCSAGSYCPSTIKKIPCTRGHYCRLGSTAERGCFKLATCDPNSENQNITAYGIMVFVSDHFLITELMTILIFKAI